MSHQLLLLELLMLMITGVG